MHVRRAARLVVLDSVGNILLLQHEDPRGLFWATPGGGLEGDEDFRQAAIREAREELGLVEVELSPLWEWTTDYESSGHGVRQLERFFLVTNDPALDSTSLPDEVRDAHARERIRAVRWWSVERMRKTSEWVFPEDLPQRVESFLRDSV